MQAASIRMTPRQVTLVQESFAKIVPIREQAAALFYNRLFAIDPSTRPLFRGDMKSQGAKLMAAIGAVVKSLDRIDTILDGLRTLARRHHRYGVREEHYASVGAALLWNLSKGSVSILHPMCGEPGPQPMTDRHAVLGKRAGLVGAEHGGRAKCLDRRYAPGQDTGAGDAPGAHHHEHGEDQWEFFRQHRHAERYAAQQCIKPAAAPEAVEHNCEGAHAKADHSKIADQAPCLHAQPRRLGVDARDRKADLADLAARTS